MNDLPADLHSAMTSRLPTTLAQFVRQRPQQRQVLIGHRVSLWLLLDVLGNNCLCTFVLNGPTGPSL